MQQLAALLLPAEGRACAASLRAALAGRLREVASALEVASTPASTGGEQKGAALTSTWNSPSLSEAMEGGTQPRGRKKKAREFDMGRYAQRTVALEIFYAGWGYHGFATQGCVRIEAIMSSITVGSFVMLQFVYVAYGAAGRAPSALRRLKHTSGVRCERPDWRASLARQPSQRRQHTQSFRCQKVQVPPDAAWADVGYSRCGRTDTGVSALRQVVALRLRSNCSLREAVGPASAGSPVEAAGEIGGSSAREEIDYVALLNRNLPDDVRVLRWGDVPVPDFSARFSAQWRQYKYYFFDDGLDIAAMRSAAARFVGSHDFRNFCKMDAQNVDNFVRRVDAAFVDEEAAPAGLHREAAPDDRPLFSFNVRGTAFLWHQVSDRTAAGPPQPVVPAVGRPMPYGGSVQRCAAWWLCFCLWGAAWSHPRLLTGSSTWAQRPARCGPRCISQNSPSCNLCGALRSLGNPNTAGVHHGARGAADPVCLRVHRSAARRVRQSARRTGLHPAHTGAEACDPCSNDVPCATSGGRNELRAS